MVHPFVSPPNFVSVTPSMSVLFPVLRRGKVSTLWSSFFFSFMCFESCILGILSFWANIHLSMSTYCASSFVFGLPHSGWCPPGPFICLGISKIHSFCFLFLRQCLTLCSLHCPETQKYNVSLTKKVNRCLTKTLCYWWFWKVFVSVWIQERSERDRKGDWSVDTMPLLRIGNKTPMEGVTETKFGAETKGWTM